MNAIVRKATLLEELDYALSAYAAKGPTDRPIVRIEQDGKSLHIETDDGRRMIQSCVQVEAADDVHSAINVHGDILKEYLALVSDKTVTLVADDRHLSVRHSTGEMTVGVLIAHRNRRDISDPLQFGGTFKREGVETLAKAASFAGMKRFDRYISGTLLQDRNDTLRMVASDQYQVAVIDVPSEGSIDMDVVIPTDAFPQVMRMMRGAKADMVALEVREKHFVGRCGSRSFAMGLPPGVFPMQYEKIFPATFAHSVTVDAPTLLETIKRAMLTHADKDKVVELKISGMDISVITPGSREVVQAIAGNGDVTIKIDAVHLRGVLENSPAPQLDINIVDASKPFTFVPAWPDGKAKYLITPRMK